MASTKDIQRRIKSINSTKKITKAMEMVAAAKMRKAIEAVLRTRTYANLSWETVLNLSQVVGKDGNELHPLLTKRSEIKKVAVVLISSNRGLCGGFNTAILNKVRESVIKYQKIDGVAVETEFILIGKKGLGIHQHYGYKIAAEFPKADLVGEVKEVVPLTQILIRDYLAGTYDKIMVAYTDFVNPAKQVPRVKQILPVDVAAQDDQMGVVGGDTRLGLDREFLEEKTEKHLRTNGCVLEYTFEPSPREVLDEMVPRLIEVQLYQALLESNASEHSARMAAMHQATDAANDMVKELTLTYNKVRQASITAEIAEICAGADALSS